MSMTSYYYHTFAAFIDEYRIRNKSKRRKINLSFQLTKESVPFATFQFSYSADNINHIFYVETPLDLSGDELKEAIKKNSILFNVIRKWLESQEIPTIPIRVDQRINGIIDYNEFYLTAERIYNSTKSDQTSSESLHSEATL